MTPQRKMLLESLSGHLALLVKAEPKKAASAVARKTRKYVRSVLAASPAWPHRIAA